MALLNQKETSLLFPQLHPYNITQLKSAVAFFVGRPGDNNQPISGVWFHGDGNMYTSKTLSDDRKIFHNDHPINEGAEYRKFFTKTDAIPISLAEMEKMLQAAKLKEDQDAAIEATQKAATNNAFPVFEEEPATAPPPPPPADAKPAGGNKKNS